MFTIKLSIYSDCPFPALSFFWRGGGGSTDNPCYGFQALFLLVSNLDWGVLPAFATPANLFMTNMATCWATVIMYYHLH